MNRALIGVTILLIFLLTGTGIAYWIVVDSAEDLIDRLNDLESKVKAEDWEPAKDKAAKVKDKWEKEVEEIWTPLLDHNQVNELENSFTRLIKLVKLESRTDALAELAVSKRLVQNVPNTERISLKNIF